MGQRAGDGRQVCPGARVGRQAGVQAGQISHKKTAITYIWAFEPIEFLSPMRRRRHSSETRCVNTRTHGFNTDKW